MLNRAGASGWPRSRRYHALAKSPAWPGVAPPKNRPIMYSRIVAPSGGGAIPRLRISRAHRHALTTVRADRARVESSSGAQCTRVRLSAIWERSVVRRKYARIAGPMQTQEPACVGFMGRARRSSTLGAPDTEAGDLLGDQAEQEQHDAAQEEHHRGGRQVQPAAPVSATDQP